MPPFAQIDYRADPNIGQSDTPKHGTAGYDNPVDGTPMPPQDDHGIHVYDLGDGTTQRSLVQPTIDGFSPDSASALSWERSHYSKGL